MLQMVVCVKQVPDTAEVRINPRTNTLVRAGVPAIINPYDAHAVEAAVQLKEKYGGQVTALSMGPPQAEEVLRRALGMGADRAILLSDRAFAGSDTLATSYILAAAIRAIGRETPVDLVFCGKQAIDGDTAQVGPGIATRLGFTQLTYVMAIDGVDLEKGQIQVQRKLEGKREVIRGRLPALLTVVKDLNELRYASLPALIRAARATIITWSKDDLDLDPASIGLKGSPTSVRRIFAPPARPGGELIPGDPRQAAAILVAKLVQTKIIADK
ncbi:acryloyl-CoA reductase electron transfer subunit gamma [Moorella thermoacetica]|nr:acryloyl-CoA reductase electron transfer subunit gamma [Moorella thermoacetica]